MPARADRQESETDPRRTESGQGDETARAEGGVTAPAPLNGNRHTRSVRPGSNRASFASFRESAGDSGAEPSFAGKRRHGMAWVPEAPHGDETMAPLRHPGQPVAQPRR